MKRNAYRLEILRGPERSQLEFLPDALHIPIPRPDHPDLLTMVFDYISKNPVEDLGVPRSGTMEVELFKVSMNGFGAFLFEGYFLNPNTRCYHDLQGVLRPNMGNTGELEIYEKYPVELRHAG